MTPASSTPPLRHAMKRASYHLVPAIEFRAKALPPNGAVSGASAYRPVGEAGGEKNIIVQALRLLRRALACTQAKPRRFARPPRASRHPHPTVSSPHASRSRQNSAHIFLRSSRRPGNLTKWPAAFDLALAAPASPSSTSGSIRREARYCGISICFQLDRTAFRPMAPATVRAKNHPGPAGGTPAFFKSSPTASAPALDASGASRSVVCVTLGYFFVHCGALWIPYNIWLFFFPAVWCMSGVTCDVHKLLLSVLPLTFS